MLCLNPYILCKTVLSFFLYVTCLLRFISYLFWYQGAWYFHCMTTFLVIPIIIPLVPSLFWVQIYIESHSKLNSVHLGSPPALVLSWLNNVSPLVDHHRGIERVLRVFPHKKLFPTVLIHGDELIYIKKPSNHTSFSFLKMQLHCSLILFEKSDACLIFFPKAIWSFFLETKRTVFFILEV